MSAVLAYVVVLGVLVVSFLGVLVCGAIIVRNIGKR